MRPGWTLMVLAAAGCGSHSARVEDGAVADAVPDDAASPPDDVSPGMPPPPVLGAQIDRAGRPMVTSLLVAPFAAPGPTTTAEKEAYNHAADPATWKSTPLQTNVTIEMELATNMAAFDGIDATTSAPMGCQNALLYKKPATKLVSYQLAADLFADDQLYVDTAMPTCGDYLSLELEYGTALGVIHRGCGGRTLRDNVVDVMYSLLAGGTEAISGFQLLIQGTLAAHADITDSFPFLGPPH